MAPSQLCVRLDDSQSCTETPKTIMKVSEKHSVALHWTFRSAITVDANGQRCNGGTSPEDWVPGWANAPPRIHRTSVIGVCLSDNASWDMQGPEST